MDMAKLTDYELVPSSARIQELNCHLIKSGSRCMHFYHTKRQERAQKETAWHLVTFTHFYISTHTHTQTLEALFVHCAARSGQMMRGMRGKG